MLFKFEAEDAYDKVVVISGDTDLIPAVKVVKSLYPAKQVGIVTLSAKFQKI